MSEISNRHPTLPISDSFFQKLDVFSQRILPFNKLLFFLIPHAPASRRQKIISGCGALAHRYVVQQRDHVFTVVISMCTLLSCMYMYAFVEPEIEPLPPVNPCVPSPCGPNAICQVHGDNIPTCSCLPNYIGRAPHCRPECTISTECEGHLACQNHLCVDPCPGSCGLYANCLVVHHTPVCNCDHGYTGDPFSVCSPIIERKICQRGWEEGFDLD